MASVRYPSMDSLGVKRLRTELGLSRAELSRFLGVSEATVARWESRQHVSEPRGLQGFLLEVLAEATAARGSDQVARLVRRCGLDYRGALSSLLLPQAELRPSL